MTNHEKGARGERLVALALNDAFPNAKCFDDLIISATNGLTQIDHVLVSTAGVFVIEVKKYSGEILGSADAPMWLQRIKSYCREFQNPLWQNARHVSALRWQLKLRPDQVHSIVVFVGRTQIVKPVAPNVIATTAAGCTGLVRYIQSLSDDAITPAEAKRATDRIRHLQSTGYTKEELLRSIRERRSRCASLQSSDVPQKTAHHADELRLADESSTSNRLSQQSQSSRLPLAKNLSTEFGIRYPFFRHLRWTPSALS